MARGHPDWGIDVDSVSFFNVDNAELAVRLGSIDALTRGGKVVFIDDFNRPILDWKVSADPIKGSVWLSTENSLYGPNHLRFKVNAVAFPLASLVKIFSYYPSYFSSYSFFLCVNGNPDAIEFFFTTRNDSVTNLWGIRFNNSPFTIDIYRPGFIWEAVHTLYDLEDSGNNFWHYVRILFDNINMEYVSIIVDTVEIDVSGKSVPSAASSEEKFQSVQIIVTGDTVKQGIVGIDGFIWKVEDYTIYE